MITINSGIIKTINAITQTINTNVVKTIINHPPNHHK